MAMERRIAEVVETGARALEEQLLPGAGALIPDAAGLMGRAPGLAPDGSGFTPAGSGLMPQAPAVPSTPQMPSVPRVPGGPRMPETPQAPGVPDTAQNGLDDLDRVRHTGDQLHHSNGVVHGVGRHRTPEHSAQCECEADGF